MCFDTNQCGIIWTNPPKNFLILSIPYWPIGKGYTRLNIIKILRVIFLIGGYAYCYLASGVSSYENDFKIILEKPIKGNNRQRNLAIECHLTGRIVGFSRGQKR